MSTKEKVKEIIKQIKPTKDLGCVQDIISGGYIDSFELMNLITVLCEKFNIEIDIDDIVPENFESVDAIAEMVERLMSN